MKEHYAPEYQRGYADGRHSQDARIERLLTELAAATAQTHAHLLGYVCGQHMQPATTCPACERDELKERVRELEAERDDKHRDLLVSESQATVFQEERDTLRTQLDAANFRRGIAETGMATAIEQIDLLAAEVERVHANALEARCPGLIKNCPAEVAALLAERRKG